MSTQYIIFKKYENTWPTFSLPSPQKLLIKSLKLGKQLSLKPKQLNSVFASRLFIFQWFAWFLSCISKQLITLFLPSVGPVPGWPLPWHGRSRSPPGGRGMVWREEWRPCPDIPETWIHPRQEPRSQSGQEEHPRQQDEQEYREYCPCHQDCHLHAIYREWDSFTNLLIQFIIHQLFTFYFVLAISLPNSSQSPFLH